jgi:uncharacterized protein (TIGR02270 family)
MVLFLGTERFLPDILEEHLETLAALWRLRQSSLRDPNANPKRLADLDERIAAHTDGLALAGADALPILEPALASDEWPEALAAGFALLKMGQEDPSRLVLARLLKAEGEGLQGLGLALAYGATGPVLTDLRKLVGSAPDDKAAAISEILAFRGHLDLSTQQMNRFLRHGEPAVRRAGWRAARFSTPRTPEAYAAGLEDEDTGVRHEARLAAAWGKQARLLDHCRKAATDLDALLLLAILGKPPDLALTRIVAAGMAGELGPRRFQILGAFGHPAIMEFILAGTASADPRTAMAAGAAFTKITGVAIESERRALLPPEDGREPDEFEKEFLDKVQLPDPELAKTQWLKLKDRFSKGKRWCRGLDVTEKAGPEVLTQLDLESRWEACLRGKFAGTWTGISQDLERFPQKWR